MKIRIFFIIQATICLTLTSVLSSGQNPTITIENGVIEGNQVEDICGCQVDGGDGALADFLTEVNA